MMNKFIAFLGNPVRVCALIIGLLEIFCHMGRYDKVSTLVLIVCGLFALVPLDQITKFCNWLQDSARKGLED
jgi:hypothetical protein